MKKILIRLAIFTWVAVLLSGTSIGVGLAQDGFQYSYTYTYDFWGDMRESPNAYRTVKVITSGMLGLEKSMRAPQGMYIVGNDIYVCDTGNNRILVITRQKDNFKLTRIIDSFYGDASPLTFSAPSDIFVSENGDMYICDLNNNRVLKLDKDLNHLLSFVKPLDATFDQSISFLPSKLVADTSGRVFVLGRNVNKGLIKYESDGSFAGFIGASEVTFNWYDYIWKTLSTQAQRAQQQSFVPTEYSNISIDPKGFFYVTTKVFDENSLLSGGATPVRRLNAIGSDILVRNGEFYPIGDLQWNDSTLVYSGPSKFEDVTVLENDIYVTLDGTRNRLFGYDQQGNMLWAFGGVGNMDGFFIKPVAIDHMGKDLLVLDASECSITFMTPTDYGNKIFLATDQYRKGEYEASADAWREVLRQNSNLDLAYIGVGRALLQEEQYEEALVFFSTPRDVRNYSEAWQHYRKEWVESYIGYIFAGLFLLLLIPPVIRRIRKIKREVEEA